MKLDQDLRAQDFIMSGTLVLSTTYSRRYILDCRIKPLGSYFSKYLHNCSTVLYLLVEPFTSNHLELELAFYHDPAEGGQIDYCLREE